ncbi:unnamed protein product [Paramecium pentaurelia]|uniref:Uncharacterized protein n=1 Tax=Paramecium pentaurelia TaxID=43138 RepID=A0A8S1XJ42_9CILI|nr:unnamed protein product [Paramecium pentaurelia]
MDKSQLLEMQLKEALDREANLKKLNESLMKAMGDISNHDRGKEIQLLNQLHEQEISKLKTILNEKIIILEYEYRNKCQEFSKLEKNYNQLNQDYEELEKKEKKCHKCTDFQLQITQILKQNEISKEGLAREFTEALNNQKSILEYDSNCLKLQLKQITFELDQELKEKEKLQKTILDLGYSHEQAQRSLLQQIADLNKVHNETIIQNNQYQILSQTREQSQAQKICQLEQDKIILEKHLQEQKDQNIKLESQIKQQDLQLKDKENKLIEQRNELSKKLINEKKIAEQCQAVALKLKNDFQRKQSILIEESLKKEQQLKQVQTQLTRQKSKNKYYENALSQVNLLEIKNSTPKQIKHKKNNFSNDFQNSHQTGHTKNALSQGHVNKIKILPSSIQKSEADSIHFNLTDMLNSTRNPDQQNLSCRQSNEDIGSHIEQFNCAAKFVQTSDDSAIPIQQLTDRQLSPRTRIQTVNPKGPPQRIRQIHADLYKENIVVRPKA